MRIGIDLGGTKIEGVVLDAAGEVCCRHRVATPKAAEAATATTNASYLAILNAIAEVVAVLEAEVGDQCPVGIGTPGAESRQSGLMKNCNTTCLNGMPLREDLSRRLGRPVVIANDANCMVLSEAVDGAGAEFESVFGVILGTGVGGGWVVGRQLLTGVNAIAGEWGHNVLPGVNEGRPCYCGRQDCIETYLSGPGLLRSFQLAGGRADSAAGVAQLARDGDTVATAALDQYCQRLARALAQVINIADPEVIVLAGGVSNIAELYQQVPAYLSQWVFSDSCLTPLRQAKHGDSSGVRGAAWLN
ncbi:ROK family protein [Spongiibacter taiwanensis]|uniref:ROK family protein n=1 Tax=Spongiibacter taiwanensis TaxID=1748242 RepID=UPI002035C695|nr:ROK family protein [Spongiibacter taiwanensis]USA44248.1 ROK family protein [Spongiibacter taiwanensis]